MRNIGRFEDQARALVLSDYLYAEGIDNRVEEAEPGWAIWVHDDARVAEAKAHLADFRSFPSDARFEKARAVAQARRKEHEQKDAAYRQRVRLAQLSMHGAQARGDLTRALLVISVLVAVLSRGGGDLLMLSSLFLTLTYPAAGLPEVMSGQVWRLVTPIVIHYGMMHLLFNMWMWWSFGQRVEARKGTRWFAVFVVVSAALSNLCQFGIGYLMAPYQISLVGGMSGVLYAVFGFVWVKGRLDPLDELQIDDVTLVIIGLWTLAGLMGGLGNIANAAHLGGLAVGVIWALGDIALFKWRKRMR